MGSVLPLILVSSADIGFDLCLTDLGDRYIVEVGSDKGREMVKGSKAASNEDYIARNRSLAGCTAADHQAY